MCDNKSWYNFSATPCEKMWWMLFFKAIKSYDAAYVILYRLVANYILTFVKLILDGYTSIEGLSSITKDDKSFTCLRRQKQNFWGTLKSL